MAVDREDTTANAGAFGVVQAHRLGLAVIAGVLAMMTVMGLLAVAGVPIGVSTGRGVVAVIALVAWGAAACGGVFWALGLSAGISLREQVLEILTLGVLLALAAGSTWLASLQ